MKFATVLIVLLFTIMHCRYIVNYLACVGRNIQKPARFVWLVLAITVTSDKYGGTSHMHHIYFTLYNYVLLKCSLHK